MNEKRNDEFKPNVLFIISDDLTANAIGSYGNLQCHTPNIDHLAKTGIQFNFAFSQYPVCGPSRAALMSGLYPQSLGVMGNGQSRFIDSLLDDRPTMTQYFRQQGYHTTRLSKIFHMRVPGDITAGVDGPDHAESWDEKFNFQGAEWMTEGIHNHLSNEQLQFKKDVHYNLGFGTAFYVVKGKGIGSEQPDFRATSKAIEIMDGHKQGQDKPFFLAVGFVRPHVPLVAPAQDYFPYINSQIKLAEHRPDDQNDIPEMGITANSTSFGITSKFTQREVLSAYYASVTFMDRQVGRLIDALKANGLSDNTIVVFTSDHGYHLGEHDLWQKLSLHEESTRIPLIINGPLIKPSVCHSIVEQIDIYPTLCELAGLGIPSHVQGVSMAPVIKNPQSKVKEQAYSVTNKGSLIRTSEWAYIKYRDNSEELYDMLNDPKQFVNLASDREYEDQRKAMAEMLDIQKAKIKKPTK